jgi:hypothetical protein
VETTTTQGQLAGLLGVEEHRLEHLRLHYWHLWQALKIVYLQDGAGPELLPLWREAPRGSQEQRLAKRHDEALRLLGVYPGR